MVNCSTSCESAVITQLQCTTTLMLLWQDGRTKLQNLVEDPSRRANAPIAANKSLWILNGDVHNIRTHVFWHTVCSVMQRIGNLKYILGFFLLCWETALYLQHFFLMMFPRIISALHRETQEIIRLDLLLQHVSSIICHTSAAWMPD